MCHPFNKASGQGNSQRGNLAGVLGGMSAGLVSGIVSRWRKKGKGMENKEEGRQEDIKELGEKVEEVFGMIIILKLTNQVWERH